MDKIPVKKTPRTNQKRRNNRDNEAHDLSNKVDPYDMFKMKNPLFSGMVQILGRDARIVWNNNKLQSTRMKLK